MKLNAYLNKINIIKKSFHERLHREPVLTHRRLRFIPNIVLNIVGLFITFLVVATLIYVIVHYLIMLFYHLN